MRVRAFLVGLLTIFLLTGCTATPVQSGGVSATTAPVAQFASAITQGTDVPVTQIITDSVSCLHDYSLSVRQMQALEQSDVILLSGGGLETFMGDVLNRAKTVVDCGENISLRMMEDGESDPHIWLDPQNAMVMAEHIRNTLTEIYPQWADAFQANTDALLTKLQELDDYGHKTLSDLSCRKLITFHDGFGYLADAYDLELLRAVEEEAGSEASAGSLMEIIGLVQTHSLPAVFTEVNGSASAASVIEAETGVSVFTLDMAMGGRDYFEAMTHNFDTLKEALQ